MADKTTQLTPLWQWKSNNDPWSSNEKAEWTNFFASENDVIERGYQNKEKQIEIGHYHIDFKRNIQINKSDQTKQRPIQRIISLDSKTSTLRQRFLTGEKPVQSYSNEFNHFCLIAAEWLYRNKDQLNVGYATWVEEAAAGILEEGNQWSVSKPEPVTAAEVVKKLLVVKDRPLAEIVKCCIYLYTLESFLYKAINIALRNGDISKVDTFGAYCYFLSLMNDPGLLKLPSHTKTVYRGMAVPKDVIEMYKSSIGTYKAWDAFTSTSKLQWKAEDFTSTSKLQPKTEELGKVLFIINFIGHSRYGCGMDISSYSAIPTEEEILLPPGTNFRVDKMKYDEKTDQYRFYITVV